MKSSISVCILAKDEEGTIKDCIRSINHFVKEIIVLDTGSTDRTREVAASEGATVIEGIWGNDFGKLRNELISYATQPYILMLDADERVMNSESIDFEYEISLLQNAPNRAGRVEINNINGDRISVTKITRFFPNSSEYRYSGRIHEQLLYNGETPETISTKIKLEHYGYSEQAILLKNKIIRNQELLLKQLADHPNEPYTLFQIGRTYLVNKQYDEASFYLIEAYNYSNDKMSFYPSIIQALAATYLRMGRWNELLALLEIGIKTYPDYTDLYYIYGSALVEMKTVEAFKLIPTAFERCVELGDADPNKYEGEKGSGTHLAHYNLGLYYELSANLEKAKYHYVISSQLGFELANTRLARLS
ncbi:glycosyltransferase [Paenibacillus woosongensis]|uniref:Glycosyltransferase n=1 Tax=Paenibacillus woosongensis TaxID=307580 RepID=A0AA95L0R5_9BACL|nr:glycosyltransferase [Paenibacillus woosongensis]WHX48714.1 glycosyltransferase [Paenibacillus woosongensis]